MINPPLILGLMNFNRRLLKKWPEIRMMIKGIRIDRVPNLKIRKLLTENNSRPFSSEEKFLANDSNSTKATPISKKPITLKIVFLLILNLRNGNLINDRRLAIINFIVMKSKPKINKRLVSYCIICRFIRPILSIW